ncbi:MAG: 16S rRNA (adenine(1518)-N(6)/adenine(1519)-N(6))-dimethyltransferase RsmA [Candidatus Omnitrophota bacterium]
MHVKPKKRLGQNFLIDKNVQKKLVASYGLSDRDRVLEIGSGYGELTRMIAPCAAFIYALEIDTDLAGALRDNTMGFTNIKIINRDILKFDLKRYFRGLKDKIKVVGNIPYYITTPIIERVLRYRDKIDSVFITVQKEFAKRIVAHPGSKEYGSFSCFVQYYAAPKILFFIKKNSFSPAPKVDSCLLRLKIREVPAVSVKDERLFFKIIRSGFNQRRKTLRKSLSELAPADKINGFLIKHGIDVDVRPEDLALVDFARLADTL